MEEELAPVVADIVVNPVEEALVLQKEVEVHVGTPEEELVRSQWEAALEQVCWAFLEWDSEESLCG